MRVPGAGCRVLSAVLGAWCGVLSAVLSAVLGAVLGAAVLSAAVMGAAGLGESGAAQAPGAASPALPDGDGAQVVRARCLSCHGADLMASQRLGEAGWGREVDKMVRWGATVPDADRAALVAYLARHFGPVPAPSHVSGGAGEAVFARACLACHGVDLTEQQRLSPAGWTREVEKMVRWGAQVSDHDKVVLVEYLASRYPAR